MLLDMTYADAVAKAEHLIALNDTTVYLRDDEGFPYDKVTRIEEGSAWRLSMPVSAYLYVQEAGLTLKLSIDFEEPRANGEGTARIDRNRLRNLMLKLPDAAREAFAAMLEQKALPSLKARTEELRQALRFQADSEDCVRGLIDFARFDTLPASVRRETV